MDKQPSLVGYRVVGKTELGKLEASGWDAGVMLSSRITLKVWGT